MFENLLTGIDSLIPTGGGTVLPPEALPFPYICSVLGAMVLGKFTGNLGSLTLVVNATALFFGAMLSSWLLRGIELPMDHAVHQPLLVSMIGMVAGALAMMWFLRSDNAHA